MRTFLIAACAVLISIISAEPANACSCVGNGSACGALSSTPVVFVGRVTKDSGEGVGAGLGRFGSTNRDGAKRISLKESERSNGIDLVLSEPRAKATLILELRYEDGTLVTATGIPRMPKSRAGFPLSVQSSQL